MINYSEKRQEYIKELEALPYGEGVLVLPNAGLQREVRLHHMVKCIGLDTLAVEVINAAGLNKYNVISRKAQELIVEKILDEHAGELKYFGKLLGKPGLVTSLVNLFTEFRRCNVSEAGQLEDVFQQWEVNTQGEDADISFVAAPVRKNQDVVLLFRAYLEYLNRIGEGPLIDLEGQYILAIEHIDGIDNLPYKKIYISDMPFTNQLEREFISALRSRVEFVSTDDFVFERELSDYVGKQDNVSFVKYGSHYDEIADTFRKIRDLLNKGVEANSIAVAVSSFKNFSGIANLAARYGIPISLADSVKLAAQPLFLRVMKQVQGYGTVRDFADQIKSIPDLVLENLFNQYAQQKISLKELTVNLKAKDALLILLNELVYDYELSGLKDKKLSASSYLDVLRDMADKKNLQLASAAENGVRVCEPINALGIECKHLFVLGLNDGEFPVPVHENWIYTDKERKILNDVGFQLPLADQRYREDERIFLMLLQTCSHDVMFSWWESDKPAYCSYCEELMLLYVRKLLVELEVQGHGVVFGQDDFPSEDKWKEYGAGKKMAIVTGLFQKFKLNGSCVFVDLRNTFIPRIQLAGQNLDDVKFRSKADAKRRQGDVEYLGNVGLIKKQSGDVTYKVTDLETFAKCPFVYLAKVVWGVQDFKDDEDVFSSADAGNLAHKTLELFVKNYIAKYFVEERFGNLNRKVLTYREITEKYGGEFLSDEELQRKVYDEIKLLFDRSFDQAKEYFVQKLIEKGKMLGSLKQQQMTSTKVLLDHWFEADFRQKWEEDIYRYYGSEIWFGGIRLSQLTDSVENGDEHILLKGRFDRLDVGVETKKILPDIPDEKGENEFQSDVVLPVQERKVAKFRVVDYKSSYNAVPKQECDVQVGVYELVSPLVTGFAVDNGDADVTGGYCALKGEKSKDEEKKVMYSEYFERVSSNNYMVSFVRYIVHEINEGRFDVRKRCKAQDSCRYCAFKTVCRIDKSEVTEDEE